MNMLKRIARRQADLTLTDDDTDADYYKADPESWDQMVREGLKELAQPTQAMIDAGKHALEKGGSAVEIFSTMVAAIESERT